MAQSNVYSLNVVGYYNVTVPAAPAQFRMVANSLLTTNETLNGVIPTAPPGTIFLKWTGSTYSTHEFIDDVDKWDPNTSFATGDGGFLRNVTGSPMTVTFVGEVRQGGLTNAVPQGYNIEGSIVPQAGTVTTALGLPVNEGGGDFILKWKATAGGGYDVFEYIGAGEWDPTEPSVAVGEGFFSRKINAPQTWVRNFTVP